MARSASPTSPAPLTPKLTPAMQQFHRFKQDHPGCVLFFRMGDFYEVFYDDAILANKVLGVTLTQRSPGQPMAGVPYHAVDSYLRRMIQAGYRVAVCDQVEDSAVAKAAGRVVKRDVTRVMTPGTLTDESLLEESDANALAAVLFVDDQMAALAWAELSTGLLRTVVVDADQVSDELARIGPSELLYCETATGEAPPAIQTLEAVLGCAVTSRPVWQCRQEQAVETLKRQYRVQQLTGFGYTASDPALAAAGVVVAYLLETQCNDQGRLPHLQPPRQLDRSEHMLIDQTSLRSLEVERTLRTGEVRGSLLGVLQQCITAMGKRLLRHWLCYPLMDRQAIEERQRVVESLVHDVRFADELHEALDQVHDVPRMMARLSVGRALPRDLVGLGHSAQQVRALVTLLADRPTVRPFHDAVLAVVDGLETLSDELLGACVEAPPAHLREGGLIRDGYDGSLDEARHLQRDSHAWLAQYQQDLITQTSVSSLKVGYNKVFGYYIELTAAHRDKAPQEWTRKQTLKNAERFITSELKEYEGKVLSAQDRAIAREQDLFAQLCQSATARMEDLQAFADTAAALDVLACFARRAVKHHYVKPTLVDESVLQIEAGRHPVLDELLGDRFVPNDVELSSSPKAQASSLALITGPNMAGKSTYIRQTALITLLAHTGSFVPASAATVGLTDRILTRIGANDELHAGQSTFMVEMTETAHICHHATARSLVILDEIGRGTSTLDGLSLAWAIAEHLADLRCRCLFATHYHELTSLADRYANVTNLNVTVREWQDEIVFLHRIVPGATDRSYGIHVAKLAGLPATVVDRANALLRELEVSHQGTAASKIALAVGPPGAPVEDLPLFREYLDHPALESLREATLETMTPLEAFDLLRRLRQDVEAGRVKT